MWAFAAFSRDSGANGVKRCGSGVEALDWLMLDAQLTGIDGFALSRRVWGEEDGHCYVPILLLRGHDP